MEINFHGIFIERRFTLSEQKRIIINNNEIKLPIIIVYNYICLTNKIDMQEIETRLTNLDSTNFELLRIVREMNERSFFMDKKIDNFHTSLDKKIDNVQTSLESKISNVQTNLDNVRTSLEEKIDNFHTSLDKKIDNVQTSLESKISNVQTNLDNVRTSLEEKIDNVQTSLESKISNVQTSLEGKINNVQTNLDKKIDTLTKFTTSNFATVNTKLDDILIELNKINDVTSYRGIFNNNLKITKRSKID